MAELQRIKATGDKHALASLVEKYGTHIDTNLRDEVVARTRSLRLPNDIALIPPTLTPTFDGTGRLQDVKAAKTTSIDAYINMIERARHSP